MPDADHMQAAQNNRDNGLESHLGDTSLGPLEQSPNNGSNIISGNSLGRVGKTLDNFVTYAGHTVSNARQQIGNAGHYLAGAASSTAGVGITLLKHPHRII